MNARSLILPRLMVQVSLLGVVWALFSPLLLKGRHSVALVEVLDAVFWSMNVPVGFAVSDALLLGIFALAVSRRKRIALWFFVADQVMGALDSLTMLVSGVPAPLVSRVSAGVAVVFALVTVPVAVLHRRQFPGKIVPGAGLGALAILLVGLCTNALLGWALIHLPLGHHHHTPSELLPWMLSKVFGSFASFLVIDPGSHTGPVWLGVALSLVSVVVTLVALVHFLRGRRLPGSTKGDDLFVRSLLLTWGQDSLGYFATRGDRAVTASLDGKAAVSHGLALGVSMAAGDPLGDPASWPEAIAAWREECARYGWVPAAISVSASGARAFREQGFIVRAMGDEAVIHTDRFSLASPTMRGIDQSVRRVRRAGVDIDVRRLRDIPESELAELAEAAETFRVGEERGYSMSLERILDPLDGSTVVVSARGADGALQGLLTFSPWGMRDLSLTLMRRSPASVNGLVEAMVATLVLRGREAGVQRISLNFAMFRRIFDEGAAVDAGLLARAVRRVLLLASRFWQLDSLYESNARYEPEWVARYMCVPSLAESTQVIAAAGVLEGFLPQLGGRTQRPWVADAEHVAAVRAQEEAARAGAVTVPTRRLSDQERVRRRKAAALREAGMEPWPAGLDQGLTPAEVCALAEDLAPGATREEGVRAGGRIRALRDHGGVLFADLERAGGRVQVVLDASHVEARAWALRHLVDLGDVIVVDGHPHRTRRGEPSLLATKWTMAAKALRPLPASGAALDARTRARGRVAHLLTDHSALELLRGRSRAVAAIRAELASDGYLEVETPMLHPVKGGANARPFITHLNAWDTDVFLRIAPELYLKRLAVAGMEAVFEMGRSFRNEGADATHNPEFTSLEVYRAGGDYTTMRHLTQRLVQRAAVAVHGAPICLRPVGSPGVEDAPALTRVDGVDMAAFDISGDWPVVRVHDAVSAAVGRTITPATPAEELIGLCREHGVDTPPVADAGALLCALYDELVEARTVRPTFYTDFPRSTSPLTRTHREEPTLAERWDLVAFGMELGTAYTELTDPIDQRERFEAQSLAAAAGDPEAMSIDEAFLDDLELGLVPTGGLGIGVDRLVMLLQGANIRQVLAFPFLRPGNADGKVR